MLEIRKVDNNKACKALFVNLRQLYASPDQLWLAQQLAFEFLPKSTNSLSVKKSDEDADTVVTKDALYCIVFFFSSFCLLFYSTFPAKLVLACIPESKRDGSWNFNIMCRIVSIRRQLLAYFLRDMIQVSAIVPVQYMNNYYDRLIPGAIIFEPT